MDERTVIVEDTFNKLRLSSPPDGWFPALQDLSWRITESNLPFINIFLSPHLKTISIYTPSTWTGPNIPHNILAAIASVISALPTPALRLLSVDIGYNTPMAYFKDSLSPTVLRCGPSLTTFTSTVPLSDAAVNHLIQLPHLRTWHIKCPPPRYPTPPPPLIFPPLASFTLGEGSAREWLSLFERLEGGGSTVQGLAPLSKVKESLKSLNVRDPSSLVVDISFTSPIQMFRNLVTLGVMVYCPYVDGDDQCAFRLNNDNITKLATALPQLESLFLGRPCLKNTCATTVACLLPISVHCVKLQKLQIHFNTTNIVDDFKNISEVPRFQELHPLPRCTLSHLYVDRMALTLDEPGFETVVGGVIDIFPSLKRCIGHGWGWGEISERIAGLR